MCGLPGACAVALLHVASSSFLFHVCSVLDSPLRGVVEPLTGERLSLAAGISGGDQVSACWNEVVGLSMAVSAMKGSTRNVTGSLGSALRMMRSKKQSGQRGGQSKTVEMVDNGAAPEERVDTVVTGGQQASDTHDVSQVGAIVAALKDLEAPLLSVNPDAPSFKSRYRPGQGDYTSPSAKVRQRSPTGKRPAMALSLAAAEPDTFADAAPTLHCDDFTDVECRMVAAMDSLVARCSEHMYDTVLADSDGSSALAPAHTFSVGATLVGTLSATAAVADAALGADGTPPKPVSRLNPDLPPRKHRGSIRADSQMHMPGNAPGTVLPAPSGVQTLRHLAESTVTRDKIAPHAGLARAARRLTTVRGAGSRRSNGDGKENRPKSPRALPVRAGHGAAALTSVINHAIVASARKDRQVIAKKTAALCGDIITQSRLMCVGRGARGVQLMQSSPVSFLCATLFNRGPVFENPLNSGGLWMQWRKQPWTSASRSCMGT